MGHSTTSLMARSQCPRAPSLVVHDPELRQLFSGSLYTLHKGNKLQSIDIRDQQVVLKPMPSPLPVAGTLNP